jgi:ribonucleoside-diphosphate reductase beta chain
MTEFNKKQIFNPTGSDTSNKIWTGDQTGLVQLNLPFNNDLLKIGATMGLDQFWRPEAINLTEDVLNYKELGKLQKIYNSFLAYLTFLDSVQISNIPVLQYRVTCPKVKSGMAVQSMQEYLHAQSYQQMILTLITESERNNIYNLVNTDKVLNARCQFIASYYQQYIDNNTVENYYLALVANYILESLYFYAGFMFFYSISSLMPGTTDMIKLIHRDEQMHVQFYQKLIQQSFNEFDNILLLNDKVYEMFDLAVIQEYNWFNYIANNDVLGLSDYSMDHYLKYLANLRLKNIGLNTLYDEVEYKNNPYKHLDKIADIDADASSKVNFFTANVTSYELEPKDYSDF